MTDPPACLDWERPAKGLQLSALSMGDRYPLVDSFTIYRMSQAKHSWWTDTIFSLDQIEDPVARTLGSIATDWVIGHEVAHLMLHDGSEDPIAREFAADQAGLVSLLSWSRPRDLSGLREGFTSNFWDYMSALIVLLILGVINREHDGSAPQSRAVRSRALGLRAFLRENVSQTTLTSQELELLDRTEQGFAAFARDLAQFDAEAPPWALACARQAAAGADAEVRRDLAEAKQAAGIRDMSA